MGDVTREQALEAARRLSRYDWQDWTAIDIEDAASIVRAYSTLAMPAAQGVEFTREQALEAALREAERFIDDEHPEWHLRLSVDQVLKVIRTALAMTASQGVGSHD
jgi:hypothetical protein